MTPLAALLLKLKKLRYLDLTKVGFSEEGLSRFAKDYLPQSQIETLNLSCNRVQKVTCADEIGKALV